MTPLSGVFYCLEKSMATSSLGSLTLDLIVKLGSYVDGLTKAERKAKDSSDKIKKSFSGFSEQLKESLNGSQVGSVIDGITGKLGVLRGGVLTATAAVAGMAVGGTVVAIAGLSAMAIQTAKADAEMVMLANRAKISTTNFQVLTVASQQLGISQDQLGSIFADVQEKLGEFSATQGGGAADFFDALRNNTKMTDAQIKEFSKTLQGKDGMEAIQLLKDKLDSLGASSQEQRFVFESLASDLGNLMPLFANGGDLLNRYGTALQEAGVIKSKEAIEQSRLLAAQTQSVQTRFDGLKNQLSIQMMPVLNSVLSSFLQGSSNGKQFSGVIQAVGVIAKGAALGIVALAAGITSIITLIQGFIEQAKNIGSTAVNVWNADGAVNKAKALWGGLQNTWTIGSKTVTSIVDNSKQTLATFENIIDSSGTKLDNLGQLYYDTTEAQQKNTSSLKVNTKEADENTKAKEKAAEAAKKLAKEQAELNKMVGASALARLRIKSAEAMAGGKVRAYTANFAQMVQTSLNDGLSRFTAFNDSYHKGTTSKHATGNAFDFTLEDASKSAQAVSQLESLAKRYGFVVRVLDEYRNPSKRATGGHIHVSVLGYKGSADALKDASAELEIVKKFNDDANKIREEAAKQQLSVRSKYFTELERIESDNEQAIKDIKIAFAGDDEAINIYLRKQEFAYKKDVEEFRRAQKQKYDSYETDLLNKMANAEGAIALSSIAQRYGKDSFEYNVANLNLSSRSAKTQEFDDYTNTVNKINTDFAAPDQETQRFKLLEDAKSAHIAKMKSLDVDYNDNAKSLVEEQKSNQLGLYANLTSNAASAWGQLTDIIGKRQGEQSKSYKAMFAMQKAMAIASATINTYLAISQAWADPSLPFYAKIAASVVAGASGIAQVIAISQQEPSGFADGGFTGHGGKYQVGGVVHKGEVVWSQDDIRRWGGVSIVESMRKGSPNGFADGGVVTGDILGGIDIGYKPNASYSKSLENTSAQQPQINIFNNSQARVNASTNDDGSVSVEVFEAHLLNALSNPNSRISKGIATHTTAGRRR